MNEYEKRKVAITRYQSGEKITPIVNSLGKTRQWFYNWLKGMSCARMNLPGLLINPELPKANHLNLM